MPARLPTPGRRRSARFAVVSLAVALLVGGALAAAATAVPRNAPARAPGAAAVDPEPARVTGGGGAGPGPGGAGAGGDGPRSGGPPGGSPGSGDLAAASLTARLEVWQRAVALLDNGRNAEAVDLFARQLRLTAGGLEAAEGVCQAGERLCRPDSALADLPRLAGAARAPAAWTAFLEGARLRRAYRHAEAARAFARAAVLSEQAADTASAAAARLASGQCWLCDENAAAVETECARLEALVAAGATMRQPEAGGPATRWRAAQRLGAEAELLRAGIRNLEGQLDEADSLYLDLLARGRALGSRQLRCDAWNGLGVALSRRRRSDEAIAKYGGALAEARRLGDPQRLGKVLYNLAYEETLERRLAAAGAHIEEARRLAEGCGLESLQGQVAAGLGALAAARGDRQRAAALFHSACDLFARTGNVRGELASHQWLGYTQLQMGEYRDAAFHYQRCLEILWGRPSAHILNWVLAGLASTQHYLGNLDAAERYYRQALAVNEQLDDRRSAALCLNSIGLLHALRGDYRQALLFHHRARDLEVAIGDVEGAGKADASIAEVLYHLGDYEQAREHCEQAIAVAEREGAEELLQSASSVMALIYSAAGRPDLAEAHFRRALDISRRWHDNLATIWALDDLAAHYLELDRKEDARPLVAEAAGLLAPEGEYATRARTLLQLARLADEPARAADLAEQALAAAREGCLPEAEWRSLSDLSQYALAGGDTTQAERSLRQALGVIESLRRDVGVDELRRHMLRPALEPYERLMDLILARSQADTAIASALVVAERSRAQVLAGQLRAAYARQAGVARAEAEQDKDLFSRLAHLQARLQDGTLPAAERRRLRAHVDELEESFRIEQLRRGGDAGSAFYPDVTSADSLLAGLRPGERMLSWFLGERRSYLFAGSNGRVRAYPLPPRAQIEEQLLLFLQMQQGQGAVGLPPDALAAASGRLFELLLGPARHEVRAARTLVLLPDGLLHRLSFSLLRDGSDYLVEDHELFVAPSLRTLRALRARAAARAQDAAPPRLSMLAVGCEGGAAGSEAGAAADPALRAPASAAAPSSLRVLPFTGAPVPRLQEAAAEAAEAASQFPGALVLTGAAADEASFKRAPLADARILHVAAHGLADPLDVRRSLLVLNPAAAGPKPGAGAAAADSAGDLEDGVLQWHEAVALPLRASLVTLSSCRSAGGVLARGEGVTGLTQAFLHAGATCVLAAQSDVPDRLARRLMKDFYRELRAGRTAAAALRQAQRLAMARQQAGDGGAAWAGFVLTGDGSVTIQAAGRARPGWLLPAVIGLALAGGAALAAGAARRRRRPAGQAAGPAYDPGASDADRRLRR